MPPTDDRFWLFHAPVHSLKILSVSRRSPDLCYNPLPLVIFAQLSEVLFFFFQTELLEAAGGINGDFIRRYKGAELIERCWPAGIPG